MAAGVRRALGWGPVVGVMVLVLPACAAQSPRAHFEEHVIPILELRCASAICHGASESAVGEVVDWDRLFFRVDDAGRIRDVGGAYEACKRLINTAEDPSFSSLLRKALPRAHGGLAHVGGDNFTSPEDPAYVAVRAWIARESDGGEDVPPLDGLEARFEAAVQPALLSASCMNANCHGPESGVPFRLDPGYGGAFPWAATRGNYAASLRMLSLDGEPMLSRLIRKGTPLHAGGIVHRGGNAGFFTGPDDPRVEAIRMWACAEREARLGLPCPETASAPIRGFVFVRGPIAAGDTFDLDRFTPGTDLFMARVEDGSLVPAGVESLTRALHAGPADIRDPAVDPTGRKVAFAMRTSADTGHDLYEMDLETRAARRLTDDAGPLAGGGLRTYRDPTYGPDGHVWFVSTRGGHVADGMALLDSDVYELDPDRGALLRRTVTPHIERKPVFLVHGEENGGEVAFTAVRAAVPSRSRAHPFRFPPGLATEYHQHFGITPPENVLHDLRELPDGRYVVTLSDLGGVWEAGRLGVIDRNFGPEIPASMATAEPAMPGYAPPLTRLDPDARASGESVGIYRDAAPLPDGRLLVSYAPETVDLSDPGAVFDLRIEVLTLIEPPDGSGPRIAERRTLVDTPGVADWDPEPIYARQPAPDDEPLRWDASAETGVLLHNGFPIIDAILANLAPAGPKRLRTDFAFVRLVEPLPFTPAGLARPVTLGGASPARILAELPLAEDGTFQVEVPAGVPFRVQGLDRERMAVGTMHNRWFFVAPGQRLVQGTPPSAYDQGCSVCHGSLDGNPEHAFVAADVVSAASVNLSRYENRNPRRPIAPSQVGAGTRIEVDFLRDVQPIIDRSCAVAGCHAGAAPAAGLGLSSAPTSWFNEAYETLLASRGLEEPLVESRDGSAARSPLLRALETHAPFGASAPPLGADDRLTLVRWIDLGAAFVGHVEGASP